MSVAWSASVARRRSTATFCQLQMGDRYRLVRRLIMKRRRQSGGDFGLRRFDLESFLLHFPSAMLWIITNLSTLLRDPSHKAIATGVAGGSSSFYRPCTDPDLLIYLVRECKPLTACAYSVTIFICGKSSRFSIIWHNTWQDKRRCRYNYDGYGFCEAELHGIAPACGNASRTGR
jgi:hypothetical protein